MSAPMKGVVAMCGCGKEIHVSPSYKGKKFMCPGCRHQPGVLAQAQPLQGGWVSGPQADLARQRARQQAQLRARQAELDRQQAELDRQQAHLGYW